MLSEKFVDSYTQKSPPWGFNGLGYIVYKRTYARILDNSYFWPAPTEVQKRVSELKPSLHDLDEPKVDRMVQDAKQGWNLLDEKIAISTVSYTHLTLPTKA